MWREGKAVVRMVGREEEVGEGRDTKRRTARTEGREGSEVMQLVYPRRRRRRLSQLCKVESCGR